MSACRQRCRQPGANRLVDPVQGGVEEPGDEEQAGPGQGGPVRLAVLQAAAGHHGVHGEAPPPPVHRAVRAELPLEFVTWGGRKIV